MVLFIFIRKHLKDYLDSDVYERAEEVSLYPEDSVEKLKDNPEKLKAEFNDICFEWEYDTIESVRKDLKSKGYDLDGLLSLEIVKEKERIGEKRKTENEMISEGQVKEKEATAEQAVPLPPRRRGMSR